MLNDQILATIDYKVSGCKFSVYHWESLYRASFNLILKQERSDTTRRSVTILFISYLRIIRGPLPPWLRRRITMASTPREPCKWQVV